jgi:hypothetical protein
VEGGEVVCVVTYSALVARHLEELAIVMLYVAVADLHQWRVTDSSDVTLSMGSSDDEEEAFKCAAMSRLQHAEHRAEVQQAEKDEADARARGYASAKEYHQAMERAEDERDRQHLF